jgi:hypothetical protein
MVRKSNIAEILKEESSYGALAHTRNMLGSRQRVRPRYLGIYFGSIEAVTWMMARVRDSRCTVNHGCDAPDAPPRQTLKPHEGWHEPHQDQQRTPACRFMQPWTNHESLESACLKIGFPVLPRFHRGAGGDGTRGTRASRSPC